VVGLLNQPSNERQLKQMEYYNSQLNELSYIAILIDVELLLELTFI